MFMPSIFGIPYTPSARRCGKTTQTMNAARAAAASSQVIKVKLAGEEGFMFNKKAIAALVEQINAEMRESGGRIVLL